MRQVSAIFAALFAGIACVVANAAAGDPPVPPGRDPGGVPVAIVGILVDYLQPHIAQRLARDGEGEIIGYDFLEGDRRPYCTCPGTEIAEVLIGEGQAAKPIVVAASDDNLDQFKRALGYAAATQAKIIVLNSDDWSPKAKGRTSLIVAAAKHFTDRLFIADASFIETEGPPLQPNIIWVAAAPDTTGMRAKTNQFADILAAVERRNLPLDSKKWLADEANIATARIGALAVRLFAVEPGLSPTATKDRIMGLAEPSTAPGSPRLIPDPRRHFWLE